VGDEIAGNEHGFKMRSCAGQQMEVAKGISREPEALRTVITASRAAKATFMSEGLVAMQSLLVPRMARVRLSPSIAEHPVPGVRLLQGIAVLRKYMQRVRWSRLPPVVAMLRSCAEAPASRACESTG